VTAGLRELGVDLLEDGNAERALGVFAEAVRRDSSDYRSRMLGARAYATLGESERAVMVLHACAEGLLRRDYLLSAIVACRQALPLAPKEKRIHETLGRIHARAARQTIGKAVVPPPMPPQQIYEGEVQTDLMSLVGASLSDAAIEVLASIDSGGSADAEARPPLPLFADLPLEAFVELVEDARYCELKEDQLLCTEGEGGEHMVVLVAGKAEVLRLIDGTPKPLAFLTGGAILGELSLLTGAPNTVTVKCITPCETLEFDRQQLNQLARNHPSVNDVFASFARARMTHNLLSHSPLFAPVPAVERAALLQRFTFRAVQLNEAIIEEGARPTGLFLVLAGELAVRKEDASGEAIGLSQLREGDIAGEIALLKGLRATATVVAVRRTAVAFLERAAVESLLVDYPAIRTFLEGLSERRLRQIGDAMRPIEIIDAEDLAAPESA
jgi:CRP-like cAMP-binding protein